MNPECVKGCWKIEQARGAKINKKLVEICLASSGCTGPKVEDEQPGQRPFAGRAVTEIIDKCGLDDI